MYETYMAFCFYNPQKLNQLPVFQFFILKTCETL